MPHQLTATEARISNLTACLTPVLTLLEHLDEAFGPPFVQPIIKTTQALMDGVQNVKRNKDRCLQLVESIHPVLFAIVRIHLESETIGSLPPVILEDVAEFTETLYKIYTFIGTQQDGNKIKQFFQQSEVHGLLTNCRNGLDQALKVFKGQTALTVLTNVIQVQSEVEAMHKELMELISTLSEGTVSDQSSLVSYKRANGSQSSSNSFSLLPSAPKIFYGRESELKDIIQILVQNSPRIAILGGGGMGKTSLARAALHHTDTHTRFEHRFFVSAEAATTAVELAALISLHLGLNPGANSTRIVVQYFVCQTSPCLLVLDNLEAPWEPTQSREGVEDFLSLLAGVEHLALMITLRGSERPAKVRWTRPFLQPLQPLSDDAAQQIFEEITDDSDISDEKTQLLEFTENMPLAVNLMAHLVEHEGLSTVLTRWKTEKTSLLSIGYDRHSNLDASIAMSYSSPRITPGARELLSLLSILPDGLSDAQLTQGNLPISDILSCKSVLLATSLAYKDTKNRLRLLGPIREHIQQFSPPSQPLVQSIRKGFHSLLALYEKHDDAAMGSIGAQITANLANLQEVLGAGLQPGSLDLTDTIRCSLVLSFFYRVNTESRTHLLDDIPLHLCDHQLVVQYITEEMKAQPHNYVDAQHLISQGISHLQHLDDPVLEAKFYAAAGTLILESTRGFKFLEKALALSKFTGDRSVQCQTLMSMAIGMSRRGDSATALTLGREAQQIAYQRTDLFVATSALEIVAEALIAFGDYTGALIELHMARELLNVCGLSGGPRYYHVANDQAEIHMRKSEYPEARNIHVTLLQNTPLDKNSVTYGYTFLNIAQIDVVIGATKEVVHQNLDAARKMFTNLQVPLPLIYCDMVLADLDLREGNTTSARARLEECLNSRDRQVVTYCVERLADSTRWPTKFAGHARWPMVCLCESHRLQEKLMLYKALLFIGDLFINEDEVTAHNLFIVALEGFTSMDVHQSRAQCLMRLADLAQRKGQNSNAAEMWREARPLLERSLQAKDISHVDSRLAALEGEHQGEAHPEVTRSSNTSK